MEKLAKNKTAPGRYALLDELRGLDLVSMMLYHACWDLVFLFGVQMNWYAATPGHLWQQSICWVFILLSGFCVPLGHHTLRRGATVFGAGVLITAVTLLFMPEERVVFGVLTLLGSAMLLTYHAANHYLGIGALRLALPESLYANYFTAYLGFYPCWFYSTDYFPLVPWLFLFWCGYFLHGVVGRTRMEALRGSVCAPLGWMGRHSLVLYLLHQPVIFGVLWVIFQIFH